VCNFYINLIHILFKKKKNLSTVIIHARAYVKRLLLTIH